MSERDWVWLVGFVEFSITQSEEYDLRLKQKRKKNNINEIEIQNKTVGWHKWRCCSIIVCLGSPQKNVVENSFKFARIFDDMLKLWIVVEKFSPGHEHEQQMFSYIAQESGVQKLIIIAPIQGQTKRVCNVHFLFSCAQILHSILWRSKVATFLYQSIYLK